MRYFVLGLCVFTVACGGEIPGAPTSPSSPLGGAAATEAQGGSDLPFAGTVQATETANGIVHHLVGTGTATHLGRFTVTGDFTVINAIGSGTAIWTAANGDQIRTNVTGQATITFPTAAIEEVHAITGGTGRFAGASGHIDVARSINLLTLISSGSLGGAISLGH